MIPMRDGKRMATDVYRPKDTSKKYPTIFVRTPYNFNYWDVRTGAPRDLSSELEAVKRGYAFVERNERGRFFSEGNYDILGPPLTDGVDELTWMSSQPGQMAKSARSAAHRRPNGARGCAQGHPAFAAMSAGSAQALVRRAVLRTGELVSRRCGAMPHLAVRPAEPGATDVREGRYAGRLDSRVEIVRSRLNSSGRLVRGASPFACGDIFRQLTARAEYSWIRCPLIPEAR